MPVSRMLRSPGRWWRGRGSRRPTRPSAGSGTGCSRSGYLPSSRTIPNRRRSSRRTDPAAFRLASGIPWWYDGRVMKNRMLRTMFVVLALAGQAAAGVFVFRAEQEKAAAREAVVSLTRDAGRAQAMIGDLSGAQTGMVAIGQDPSYWVPKVAT